MRESRSCGSVRAEGSNVLGYSQTLNSKRGHNVKYLPMAFTEHGAILALMGPMTKEQ
jgi:hypothetical protein